MQNFLPRIGRTSTLKSLLPLKAANSDPEIVTNSNNEQGPSTALSAILVASTSVATSAASTSTELVPLVIYPVCQVEAAKLLESLSQYAIAEGQSIDDARALMQAIHHLVRKNTFAQKLGLQRRSPKVFLKVVRGAGQVIGVFTPSTGNNPYLDPVIIPFHRPGRRIVTRPFIDVFIGKDSLWKAPVTGGAFKDLPKRKVLEDFLSKVQEAALESPHIMALLNLFLSEDTSTKEKRKILRELLRALGINPKDVDKRLLTLLLNFVLDGGVSFFLGVLSRLGLGGLQIASRVYALLLNNLFYFGLINKELGTKFSYLAARRHLTAMQTLLWLLGNIQRTMVAQPVLFGLMSLVALYEVQTLIAFNQQLQMLKGAETVEALQNVELLKSKIEKRKYLLYFIAGFPAIYFLNAAGVLVPEDVYALISETPGIYEQRALKSIPYRTGKLVGELYSLRQLLKFGAKTILRYYFRF